MQVVLIIIAVICFAIAVMSIRQNVSLGRKCTAEVEGIIAEVIVETDTGVDSDGGEVTTISYTPVYEYTVNGETRRMRDQISDTGKTKHKAGARVIVLYNPDNPDEYMIKGATTRRTVGMSIFLFAVGIILILMAFTAV